MPKEPDRRHRVVVLFRVVAPGVPPLVALELAATARPLLVLLRPLLPVLLLPLLGLNRV